MPILPWPPPIVVTFMLQAVYQYDPYYSNLVYSQPVVRKPPLALILLLSTGRTSRASWEACPGLRRRCGVACTPNRAEQAQGLQRR